MSRHRKSSPAVHQPQPGAEHPGHPWQRQNHNRRWHSMTQRSPAVEFGPDLLTAALQAITKAVSQQKTS